MPRKAALVTCGAFVMLACSSDNRSLANAPAPSVEMEAPREAKPHARPDGGGSSPVPEEEDETPRLDLHDPALVPTFSLSLDAAAIATLSDPAQAAAKVWAHGSFRFENVAFSDVGVRAKGSGTYRSYPGKVSLKVKFNKFVKGQKLHGLEELTLNNSVDDRTYLEQRLTYHVFREMGLPAPKANAARLTINEEDFGLYTSIETPDEQLLKRIFGKDQVRSLYEAHTPGTWLPGTAEDWETDVAPADAPDGTKPDLDRLFQAVASAKDETLMADLSPYLDTKSWLRFCATEAATGLFDHYAYNKYGAHNYFMIGDNAGKFVLMPWSADDSMDPSAPPDISQPNANVVFGRCKNSTQCWDAYRSEAASVIATFEALRLSELARGWHAQIDELASADPKREVSVEAYKMSTDALFEWLDERPAVLRAQLGL